MNPVIRAARRFLAAALIISIFVKVPLSMGVAATFPDDQINYSPVNGFSWYEDGLGDADEDGIPNFHDPAPYDPSNTSPVNGISWGQDALSDADGDGTPNFNDQYAYDMFDGNPPPSDPDSDGDGIPDSTDPAPWDYSNYSQANGMFWNGSATGDADGDGIANFNDQYPYDMYNGNPPMWATDSDGDGIPDTSDPSPWDSSNFSSANGQPWYITALDDLDGDGIANFYDQWPDDPYNGNPPVFFADYDDDGIADEEDPAPYDSINLSPINGIAWLSAALSDADGDGNLNFNDPWPYDPNNGNGSPSGPPENEPDSDGDGISDRDDPVPNDATNTSPVNGIAWYNSVWGDSDLDGVLDYWDPEPYGQIQQDTDGDGLLDNVDPAPNDPNNYSSYNDTNWNSDALGDNDGDGTPNFFDAWPYDPYDHRDSDMDGITDDTDPAPSDYDNYSSYNSTTWGFDALGDLDNDGTLNFFDPYPYDSHNGDPSMMDSDNDGYTDDIDPAPQDPNNHSEENGLDWYDNALGDNDGDGINNFNDPTPNGDPNDPDGDHFTDNDPAPQDYSNYSSHNMVSWYQRIFEDDDNDTILNFFDLRPDTYDEPNPPDPNNPTDPNDPNGPNNPPPQPEGDGNTEPASQDCP